jgi:hypothetical protein
LSQAELSDMLDTIANLRWRIEQLEATPRTFLSPVEIAVLAGRKSKTRQIEALRGMGVPFFIKGIGHPVVARSVVEGGKAISEPPKAEWVPPGLRPK